MGPDKTLTLTATVVTADAFVMTQQPLTFTVPMQNAAPWVWPVFSATITGKELRATLGPQQGTTTTQGKAGGDV